MEISTQSILDRLTPETSPYQSTAQGNFTTSYIVVGLGAAFSVPLIVYIIYTMYRHRKRHEYIDLDKTIASIKTASPRESESHDARQYFESSTESSTESSSGDEPKPATFYIGMDSEEELTSSHFIKKSYLAKVHPPKQKPCPPVRCLITL